MSSTESRIPCLDGLRAVAIGLVLLGHLTWNQHMLGRNGQYLKLGDIGVRLFFVLSGFLITGISSGVSSMPLPWRLWAS